MGSLKGGLIFVSACFSMPYPQSLAAYPQNVAKNVEGASLVFADM
jgi:hypothetical protein